jgi:hypothetical protein
LELTKEEEYVFTQTLKTRNLDLFTEFFFRLPWSGTWYTGADRPTKYAILHAAWVSDGRPDESMTLNLEGQETTFRITYDQAYYGTDPMFLLPHGFRMLSWVKRFLNPAIPLGVAITGTGTGKTCGLAIYYLTCCALFPGFKFLNLAPSRVQAELMLGEIEKWCLNTRFRKFIRESKGSNPLWISRPHATLEVEVQPGYASSFVCQTINRDATAVIGQERDAISCDEAQLLHNIDEALPILGTRLRGMRSTGELRWGVLRWISNPGKNPELTALMEHYKVIEEQTGEAIVLEGIHSNVNTYVTASQLKRQRLSLRGQRTEDRWHGGDASAVYENVEIPEDLLEACYDPLLDEQARKLGEVDDLLGLRSYELPHVPGSVYVVVGDVGKMSATTMSSQNLPCVMVFDVTNFLERPIRLTAFHWFDGHGSYEGFIETMKRMMYKYHATGYYDATTVQTALEDIRDAAFDGWPTTPVYFSGSVVPKRWALTIVIKLMSERMFRWPRIKSLWHQARMYELSARKNPDDVIATLMVFGLALRTEDTLWTKLEERYHWEVKDEKLGPRPVQPVGEPVEPVRDRFARRGGNRW